MKMQEQMKTDAYTIPFSNKGSEGNETMSDALLGM